MTNVDYQRVREVFIAARDADPLARRVLLDEHCGGNAALRDEVESLLAHHDAAETGEVPVASIEHGWLDRVVRSSLHDEQLPRPFGGFELLELIGHGGMGTVYRARQRTPDRTVALKVIRPGLLSRTLLARFEYEANVLGRLQHPGIAQIFEAGAVESADGARPYFGMELIEGDAIDEHVRRHDLSTAARIDLLIGVCEAVHHAHQKGVIHRDLKPANILVDAGGQPKILDFGIARATNADLRTTTRRTSAGRFLGTVPYMSPEQIAGDSAALDLRSDVYALGVLAHELLSGDLPYAVDDKPLPEALRIVRDAAPIRLATLSTAFRGDIDTIVSKALEKAPERRYQSALALAEDFRRHRRHQPILARPPRFTYQLRLFSRRHRAIVVTTVLAVLGLLAATGVSVGFALSERAAAEGEARQRLVAERTNAYLVGMFALPDPHERGADFSVAKVLDLTVRALDANPDELPEVEARVRAAIGRTYVNLLRFGEAEQQLGKALALADMLDTDEHASVLMGIGNVHMNRGNRAGADAVLREAVALLEVEGGERLDGVQASFASNLVALGRFDEAAPIVARLIEHAERDDEREHLIARLRTKGRLEIGLGRAREASETFARARAIADELYPQSHPAVIALHIDLAKAREGAGDLEGALEAALRAADLADRHRVAGSWDWMHAWHYKHAYLKKLGRRQTLTESVELFREKIEAEHGFGHRIAREATEHLVRLYEESDNPAQAAVERARYDQVATSQPEGRPDSAH